MAYPAGLTLITVTGTIAGPAAADRAVTFRLPGWLQSMTSDAFVEAHTIVAACDTDGEFSVQVPATDDPAWTPTGWTYNVTIASGGRLNRGTLTVPYDGGPLDLADRFNPDEPVEPGVAYALINHTHSGGGGGPTAWADITGKPSTFPPTLPIAQSGITGLTAALAGKQPAGSYATTGQLADVEADVVGVLADVNALDVRVTAIEDAPGGGGTPATFARGYLNGTGTDVTVPTDAAWAPVTGISWSIPAAAGDDVSTTVRLLIDVTTGGTDYFDLAVIVAGAPVRCASSGTATPSAEGDPALYPSTSVRFRGSQTGMDFTVQAGDLAAGNVTFGLIHKGGAGAAKVYRSDAFPLRWSARNDH